MIQYLIENFYEKIHYINRYYKIHQNKEKSIFKNYLYTNFYPLIEYFHYYMAYW